MRNHKGASLAQLSPRCPTKFPGPAEEIGSSGKMMVELERQHLLAVWQDCCDMDSSPIGPDQEEGESRTTLHRKRRKCRYGFPDRFGGGKREIVSGGDCSHGTTIARIYERPQWKSGSRLLFG